MVVLIFKYIISSLLEKSPLICQPGPLVAVAVGFKANCLTREPGLWVECPPWGSFYGILARINASFRENHEKLRTARLTSATGV